MLLLPSTSRDDAEKSVQFSLAVESHRTRTARKKLFVIQKKGVNTRIYIKTLKL